MLNGIGQGDFFLSIKGIAVKLVRRIPSALLYLFMKMVWFIQLMYQVKNVMFISKILTDLCVISKTQERKNAFAEIVFSTLEVKKY